MLPPLEHCECELQSFPSQSEKEAAVLIKNACKSYGPKKDPLAVLDGLSMSVAKGSIYGLLGASGCGKTTLLGCLLGRRKLNSGEIWLFGEPSDNNSAVQTRVGYMPQDTALYADFTIHETLVYFGCIAGMSKKQIRERSDTLMKLMGLPCAKRMVKTLSGGEQRRVSLLAALLHEPELLILDEPTVGLDSILRESIWQHMKSICSSQNTTIIITTHYIEEARQAHTVALMRGGKLLAEEPPEKLLAQHKAQSLEEVFLKLSVVQNANSQLPEESLVDDVTSREVTEKSVRGTRKLPPKEKNSNLLPNIKINHMKALMWKNALWWIRHPDALIFIIGLSVVVPITIHLTTGVHLHNVPIAVVDYETNNSINCDNVLTCQSKQLSCNYLKRLESCFLILVYYDSAIQARESVIQGETYASILIKSNYSDALRARIDHAQYAETWELESSNIEVINDVSALITSNYIKMCLMENFQKFVGDLGSACGLDPRSLELPVNFKSPVHGADAYSYGNFVLTGFLIMFMFALGVLMTCGTMSVERTEAGLERSFVMGITETELLLAHALCESAITLVQTVLTVTIAFGLCDTTYKGSILLASLLLVSAGFCGISYGLFFSSIFDKYIVVFGISVGIITQSVFISGVVWPREGTHYLFQYLSSFLPFGLPTDGLRSILQRNWGFSYHTVYMSFVVLNVWTAVFLLGGILWLKCKKL